MDRTTIQISENLRKNLKILASYRDVSYEDILGDLLSLLSSVIPFENEKDFASWFEKNFEIFSFRKIVQKNKGFPDYIVEDSNGKEKGVELEIFPQDFVRHKHDPKKVDFVVSVHSTVKEVSGVPVLSLMENHMSPESLVKRRDRISLTFNQNLLRELDLYANQKKMSRSEAVEGLVRNNLENKKTCVILAGGKPRNLYIKELKTYRPLVKIRGRTLIENIVIKVVEVGYAKIIVVGLKETISRIKSVLGDGLKYNARITYIEEEREMGTAKTIEAARDYLKTDFLFVPCDQYFDFSLKNMEAFHMRNDGVITLAVHTRTSFDWKLGNVQMDGDHIIEFEEKPKVPKTHLFSAFIGFVRPQIFNYIPPGELTWSVQEDILPKLAKEGKLFGYAVAGNWINVHKKKDVEKILELEK